MTKQELREEIRMIHFPDIPEEKLLTPLLDKLILKAYERTVTMGMTYPQNTDKALVDGSYDMSQITDFWEPRWYEYNGNKLVKMEYENISQVPVVYSSESDRRYYYQKDKTLYMINGTTETVSIFYWAKPPVPANDTTEFVALEDTFSPVIVSRVCWQLAQGLKPKLVTGYIAGYNEEFKKLREYYIKKHSTNRGYVTPVDF